MRGLAFGSALLLSASAYAQTDPGGSSVEGLGEPGESCRARSECKPGLKCLKELCTDEHEDRACGATRECGRVLKCIAGKCTTALAAAHPAADRGLDLDDGALHPFMGVTFGGGFDVTGETGTNGVGASGNFGTFDGAFLFALDGGFFIGNHQLLVEFAPSTYVCDGSGSGFAATSGTVFEMTASYAYFVPLAKSGSVHVYYPFRFGAGTVVGGPNTNGLVYFQLRADLLGAAIQVGHLVIDLHLPSFRYAITDTSGTQFHVLDWLFGTTLGYAF